MSTKEEKVGNVFYKKGRMMEHKHTKPFTHAIKLLGEVSIL